MPADRGAWFSPPGGGSGTRRRILEAAAELFACQGFERTTVRTIAERCGITDPALYHYFPSKRAILETLWLTPLADPFEYGMPPPTPEQVATRIAGLFTSWATRAPFVRLLYRQALAGDPAAIEQRRRSVTRDTAAIASWLDQLYGPHVAMARADTLITLFTGLIIDTYMRSPDGAAAAVRSEPFAARLKALVDRLVPPPTHLVAVS